MLGLHLPTSRSLFSRSNKWIVLALLVWGVVESSGEHSFLRVHANGCHSKSVGYSARGEPEQNLSTRDDEKTHSLYHKNKMLGVIKEEKYGNEIA